jgi:hypothetical protein
MSTVLKKHLAQEVNILMASERDPIQLKQVKKHQNLEPHGIEIAHKWDGVANNINLKAS